MGKCWQQWINRILFWHIGNWVPNTCYTLNPEINMPSKSCQTQRYCPRPCGQCWMGNPRRQGCPGSGNWLLHGVEDWPLALSTVGTCEWIRPLWHRACISSPSHYASLVPGLCLGSFFVLFSRLHIKPFKGGGSEQGASYWATLIWASWQIKPKGYELLLMWKNLKQGTLNSQPYGQHEMTKGLQTDDKEPVAWLCFLLYTTTKLVLLLQSLVTT